MVIWLLFVSWFTHLRDWLAIQLLGQYLELSDVAQSLSALTNGAVRCRHGTLRAKRLSSFYRFTSHLYPEMKCDYFFLSSWVFPSFSLSISSVSLFMKRRQTRKCRTHVVCSGNCLGLHSGYVLFESRTRRRPCWLSCFVVFLSPSI
jgi:hypothetical protein